MRVSTAFFSVHFPVAAVVQWNDSDPLLSCSFVLDLSGFGFLSSAHYG
jgi:hypothetical protein